MHTLVIAEHDNESLSPAALPVITAAQGLGQEVQVIVAGRGCGAAAAAAAATDGVSRVLHAEAGHYEHGLAEELAPLVVSLCEGAGHILAPATTFGRNLLPRVAALLGVDQISDVLRVVSADTFVRPMYAGNALATVRSTDPVKVMTVRPAAFEPAAGAQASAPVEQVEALEPANLSRVIDRQPSRSTRPDLGTARIVIAGGRGLGSAENFRELEALADRLGAAVGASRAAVDAGYISNDYQVGQTGKIIAPDLYIAVGISGAIQHLAGIRDSKCIVAINNDEEAPIFEVADYGLVADLFEVLPELGEALA